MKETKDRKKTIQRKPYFSFNLKYPLLKYDIICLAIFYCSNFNVYLKMKIII